MPTGIINGRESNTIDGLTFPREISVKRESWAGYNFDKNSALKVKGSEVDGYDFFTL